MTVLDEMADAVARAAEEAGPSLVRIGRDGGRGAGVVIRDGFVLTSAHNLRGPSVTVTFTDGRVATGEVRAADMDGDLAVLAVDTAGSRPVRWEPASARLGQVVFALGTGRGGGVRVAAGHVCAVGAAFRGPRGRLIDNGFEHTAPVGRGSSGGPVVDGAGSLVGINTHRPGDGLYLAIPADQDLATRVDALVRGESPRRRRLGVALVPTPVARRLRSAVGLAPRDGLLVRDVDPEGPAAEAGMAAGDLIVTVAGAAVATVDQLVGAVEDWPGDAPLAVGLVRGTEDVTVEVRFTPAPEA